jgi:hypothetical protein
VARLYAALARAAAVESNRAGDFASAARNLERVAANITGYAGNDTVLRSIAFDLRADVGQFTRAMSAHSLKSSFFGAEAITKYRDNLGRARKGPEA